VDTGVNILVTGGAGFLGSYLCREFYNLRHHVTVVDIERKNSTNLDYDYRCVDILDKSSLIETMKGVDLVVHLAAKHRFFGVSKKEFFLANEEGTKNVLQAMDAGGVKKLIFYSTVAVYGNSDGPTDENTEPKPSTSYGLSKLAAEQWIKEWAFQNPDRTAVIVRPTVIFGPYNKGNIYRLIRQIYHRGYVPIGEGSNIKSVAYIDNLVKATLFLLQQDIRGVEIFNYADTPHMPYRRIVDIIYSELRRRPPGYHLPLSPMLKTGRFVDEITRKMGIEFSVETTIRKMNSQTWHSADKIRTLGFSPPLSSEDGLREMVRWYIEEKAKDKRTLANA
jgi:nucleoside-diphosphate-sugar epimerase